MNGLVTKSCWPKLNQSERGAASCVRCYDESGRTPEEGSSEQGGGFYEMITVRRFDADSDPVAVELFDGTWDAKHWQWQSSRKRCHGAVALYDSLPVGVIWLTDNKLDSILAKISVAGAFRRMGVGSSLIEWMTNDLHNSPFRKRCYATVGEKNLTALNFLKAMGFMAELPMEPEFKAGEDGIRMMFEV